MDPIPPSALPADRFCAVCARLLVNQRGGSEYEQVADVCCDMMCAHCVGEKVGAKKRPPPFDFQEMRTISGAILHPADLTQHSAADLRCRTYMSTLLDAAKTANTVHNVPMVGLGSGKPAGVDIGFMSPDHTDDVRARQAEWDKLKIGTG